MSDDAHMGAFLLYYIVKRAIWLRNLSLSLGFLRGTIFGEFRTSQNRREIFAEMKSKWQIWDYLLEKKKNSDCCLQIFWCYMFLNFDMRSNKKFPLFRCAGMQIFMICNSAGSEQVKVSFEEIGYVNLFQFVLKWNFEVKIFINGPQICSLICPKVWSKIGYQVVELSHSGKLFNFFGKFWMDFLEKSEMLLTHFWETFKKS